MKQPKLVLAWRVDGNHVAGYTLNVRVVAQCPSITHTSCMMKPFQYVATNGVLIESKVLCGVSIGEDHISLMDYASDKVSYDLKCKSLEEANEIQNKLENALIEWAQNDYFTFASPRDVNVY